MLLPKHPDIISGDQSFLEGSDMEEEEEEYDEEEEEEEEEEEPEFDREQLIERYHVSECRLLEYNTCDHCMHEL